MRTHTTTLSALALSLLVVGCAGTRKLTDPTLVIRTDMGAELGASTNYGIVFLGRTASSGYVDIESWFGDGPSIEHTLIEPLGGGLYTAETEIRLPNVPMTFVQPRPGEKLLIRGRTSAGGWEQEALVQGDDRVHGLLLDVPSRLQGRADQVGAGVYVVNRHDRHDKRLVGLVSGKIRLEVDGRMREFLTVIGPEDLWRLVTHRRDLTRRKPWVYRDDIM